MNTAINSAAIGQAIKNLKLFGVVACPSQEYRPATPPGSRARFGIHTPVYGSPVNAWVLAYDDAGDITGYTPIGSIARHKYHPSIATTAAPAVGEPYVLGMVLSAQTPEVPIILAWPQVAAAMTAPSVYPLVREASMSAGLAGHTVATFVGDRVPWHVANGSTRFDLSAAEAACWQMHQLKDAMETLHPKWAPSEPAKDWAFSLAKP